MFAVFFFFFNTPKLDKRRDEGKKGKEKMIGREG